jgi:multidrug efflux pump subunit AcrB
VGAGSTSRRPLGYAIVGGILFSTVLTLFVVPVAYTLLDRLVAPKAREVRLGQPVEAD